MLLNPGL